VASDRWRPHAVTTGVTTAAAAAAAASAVATAAATAAARCGAHARVVRAVVHSHHRVGRSRGSNAASGGRRNPHSPRAGVAGTDATTKTAAHSVLTRLPV